MKAKYIRIFSLALLASAATLFQGCQKDGFKEMTEIPLIRCLQPTELKASVSNVTGTTVTLKWNTTKDAEKYVVVLSSDDKFATEVLRDTILPAKVPLSVTLTADCTYYFKVQGISSKNEPSKWAEYTDEAGKLKAIKTFAVKDPLYPKPTARAKDAVTVSWSTAIADYKDVDYIYYGLPGAAESELQSHQLDQAEIDAGSAQITGLTPSTEYEFILRYKTATRGTLSAWTLPDPAGTTEITTSAALIQGIADGAKMLLKYEGSPYTISSNKGLDAAKGFSILGELSPAGERPVVYGAINFTDAYDGNPMLFESIELNGGGVEGFVLQHKEGSTSNDVQVGTVVYRNCKITGYTKGILYEWGKTFKMDELTYDHCLITAINPDGTVGGDGLDIRNATTITKLNFTHCTIWNGFRTLIRIDANPIVGDVTFENNLLMNVCFVDNTNNGGIFAFQKAPSSLTLKKNIFLNMGGKSTLVSANTKYIPMSGLGVTAAKNYFFNLNETFFNDNGKITDVAGAMLASDPCYNAKGEVFNLTIRDLADAQVGPSTWWTAYSKEPEDLTLNVLDAAKTWNLTDAKLFSGTAKEPMVRGDLMIVASSDMPVGLDGAIEFYDAAAVTRKGVPQDGYLRFKVSTPGSVVLKPVGANTSAHFTVGTCPIVEGTECPASVSIKGGASPMSCMDGSQKIVISDVTEPTMVLIYPSGALKLEKLAWSTDVSDVNTALPTPSGLKASPASQKSGEGKDVVVTWDAVAGAGGYSVVFKGKTYDVEEGKTEYTVEGKTVKMLDAGAYQVDVYALPTAEDIYNTMSAAGSVSFAVVPAGGDDPTTGTVVHSTDDFNAALAAGKDDIIFAADGAPYAFTEAITLTYPVKISGEGSAKPAVSGNIILSGDIAGDVTVSGLTFSGADNFISLAEAGVTMGTLTVSGCDVSGYGKSLIYSNFATATVENIVVKGLKISNLGGGQGTFDFRKGTIGTLKILENTLKGGRDFIRMDANVASQSVHIIHNTFDGLTLGNGNGVLYVRASVPDYKVIGNLFLNEVAEGVNTLLSKASGVVVPSMASNFYHNYDTTNFFSGVITKDIAIGNGGTTLAESPVKDAASGDYTLVSGLAISSKVGDPRWNPSAPVTPTTTYTVKNADEFKSALEAGKTEITLAYAGSPYVFTESDVEVAAAFEIVPGLKIYGEVQDGKKPEFHGSFKSSTVQDLGDVVFQDVYFQGVMPGGSRGVAIEVSAVTTARSITMKDCIVDGFGKSVLYVNADGSAFGATVFNGVETRNFGTGQGVFDIRKGACTNLTIQNCTLVGGRDLVRADASTITGSFNFVNNTIDGSNLGVNGNGIMYVRATPSVFKFRNNLFLNEIADTKTVLLSKTSGVTVPTDAGGNYVHNYDTTNFFSGLFTKETAGMATLSYCPVKDAANGDYTLTDALCLSSNVGALKWNPNRGRITTEITVSTLEEFYNAVNAGKTSISIKADTIDFTLAPAEETEFASGVLSLSQSLTIKGVKTFGKKPVISGGFKLLTGVGQFVAEGIAFNGIDKTIGTLVEVGGALEASKVQLRGCDVSAYNKSLFYGNAEGIVGSASFSGLTVTGFGTGQGMIDVRKKVYGSIIVENSTFTNGGRDFIRADASVAGSICIRNNTFSGISIEAANSILYVRADVGDQYVVENNIFLNETGTATILAKTGTKVPVLKKNFFFNCSSDAFWNGTIDEAAATAGGGATLAEDPCVDSANGNFKVTNADVKAARAGDPRWLL